LTAKTLLLVCLFCFLALLPVGICSAAEATPQELTRLSEIFSKLEQSNGQLAISLKQWENSLAQSEAKLQKAEQNLLELEARLQKVNQELQQTTASLSKVETSLKESKKEIQSLKLQRNIAIAAAICFAVR
jgi:septal ring factor EnvC (AmiA/AmiB activator)